MKEMKDNPRSIRFTDDQIKRLKSIAEKYQLTESHIVRAACDYYLESISKSKTAPMPRLK